MNKSISGIDIPDEVALALGRFILYFGYLEFQLWVWFNEVWDDEERARKFVDKMLDGKIGSTKGTLEKLNLSKADRKALLSFLERIQSLAHDRNLVCHNPYMTLAGGEPKKGAIFGIRSATHQLSSNVRKASLTDIRRFESEAAQLCAACHQLFPILKSGLPPRKGLGP